MTDRRVVVTGIGTVNASTAGGRDALARRARPRPLRHRPGARVRHHRAVEPARRRGGRRRARVSRGSGRGPAAVAHLPPRPRRVPPRGARRARWRAGPGSASWWAPSTETSPRAATSRRGSCAGAGRPLADDLPQHRDEHDGVRRGHRDRREGPVDHGEPGHPRGGPGHRAGARLVADGHAEAVVAGGVDELVPRRVPAAGPDGRALPDGRAGRRGLPAVRGRSQRPGAGRGRHVPRAGGAGGGAGARRAGSSPRSRRPPGANVPVAPHTAPRGAERSGLPGGARSIRGRGPAGIARVLRRRQRRSRGRRLGARAARPTTSARPTEPGAAALAGAALRPARRAGRAARGRGRAGRGARARPRCSCTASRAAAAGPRWSPEPTSESGRRSPDRHPGLQRGRHHRRHGGARPAHGPVLVVDDGSTDRERGGGRARPAPRSSRSAGGGARARRCGAPSRRRWRAGSSGW